MYLCAFSAILHENIDGSESPILLTQFVLQIPNIVTSPSIEELQSHFNKMIMNILHIHKSVIMWGQRHFPTSNDGYSTGNGFFIIRLYCFILDQALSNYLGLFQIL